MAMELDNSFTVPVPPDQAWDVLLDVQRIAPCMPGATVDEVEGDVVNGRIKVKVGPVSLTYRGTAKFTERDPDARLWWWRPQARKPVARAPRRPPSGRPWPRTLRETAPRSPCTPR